MNRRSFFTRTIGLAALSATPMVLPGVALGHGDLFGLGVDTHTGPLQILMHCRPEGFSDSDFRALLLERLEVDHTPCHNTREGLP